MKKTVHATLADVARQARVGTSTVSRVINGGDRVSAKTLARVHEVIRKLNYHPNQAARILKGERTHTIGLIVPSIADSFFALCAEAAQEVCRAHKFLLTVACSNNDPGLELEILNTLLERRMDGILLAPAASRNPELVRALQRASVPTVAVDRPIEDCAVPHILSNNYRGAKQATQHLIDHGYKRIVLLGMQHDHPLYTNQERIRGYRHAMQAAGMQPKIDVSMTNYDSAELVLKSHLDGPAPPEAIFAIRNQVAVYCFEALRKYRIRIPATVALLGFDDFELAGILDPAVTVVKQPAALMGKIAMETLLEQLRAKRRHGFPSNVGSAIRNGSLTRKLDTELVVRASCGCGGNPPPR